MPKLEFEQNRFQQFKEKRDKEVEEAKVALRGITGFIGFTSFAGLMAAGMASGASLGASFVSIAGLSGGTFLAIIFGLVAIGITCGILALAYYKGAPLVYKLFRYLARGNESYCYNKDQAENKSKNEYGRLVEIVRQLALLSRKGVDLIDNPRITAGLTPVQLLIFNLLKRIYGPKKKTLKEADDEVNGNKKLVEYQEQRAQEILGTNRALKAYASELRENNPNYQSKYLDDGVKPGRSPFYFSIPHKIRGWFKPQTTLSNIGRRHRAPRTLPELKLTHYPHHLFDNPEGLIVSLLTHESSVIDKFADKYLAIENGYLTQTPAMISEEMLKQNIIHQEGGDDQTREFAGDEFNYLASRVMTPVKQWYNSEKAILMDIDPVAAQANAGEAQQQQPVQAPAPVPAVQGDAAGENAQPAAQPEYLENQRQVIRVAPIDMTPAQLIRYHSFLKSQQVNAADLAKERTRKIDLARLERLAKEKDIELVSPVNAARRQ